MTRDEWLELEAYMAANFQNAKLQSEHDVTLRHLTVADLPYDAVLAVLVRMARDGARFAPHPGELYAEVSRASRPPAPAPGTILALLCSAASRFGADREREAVAWLAGESPHAARFAVEHGWRQFCREGLFDPEFGGAVRQRLELSAKATAAGLEREFREGRVLPLVSEHLARLERGESARSGLRQLRPADVIPIRRGLGEGDAA